VILSTAPARSRGPVAGLAAQGVLLLVLDVTVGLTAAGWAAGIAYALGLWMALTAGLQAAGMRALGPANGVTLARASLVAGVTALVVTSIIRPVPTAVLVTLVGLALALDGVDGQVARRTRSISALGARFDMEVDAFLILVLSVFVGGMFGWWTVAIGAFRYVFMAAARGLPWLTVPLPPRFSRKVVAALQGVVLVVATAQVLPSALAYVAVLAALVSLTWSFGRDIAWLWRVERARRAPVPALPVVRQPVPA
jgi:phosphatidylglycerophosphate synthase